LVVGKTVRVRNTVTGGLYEILYGTEGQRLITAVNGKTPDLNLMGDMMHGLQNQYEIRNGRLITNIAGAPFEVTVYKLGNKYYGARSNEFGYANYEVNQVEE